MSSPETPEAPTPMIVRTDDTCFGSPRLGGTRLTVTTLAGRFAAGETIDALAEDYAVPREWVELACQALCAATFGRRGLYANVARQLDALADQQFSFRETQP